MRRRWIISGIVLLVLAGAYTGYWFWLAQSFERNLAAWIEQQRAMGYRFSYAANEPTGFPFSISQVFARAEIDSPPGVSPWKLRTDALHVSIAPWNPLRLGINNGYAFDYFLELGKGDQQRSIRMLVGSSWTGIAFSNDGAMPAFDFRLDPVFAFEREKRIALLHDLRGRIDIVAPKTGLPSSAVFALTLKSVHFDQLVHEPLGQDLANIAIEGKITGAVSPGALIDVLDSWRDRGGTVDLTRLTVVWGPLALEGDGTIALDQRRQPIGAFSAVVSGYNETIDAAVARGMMTAAQGTAAKLWLRARAEKDEHGLKVKLPLTIQDGFVSMGPIKLAQVPHIAWQ